MSISTCKIAAQTRGFYADYQWQSEDGATEDSAREAGKVVNDLKPGVLVKKNGNNDFGVFLAGINRPDATDFRGTKIRLNVYIGGLAETQARAAAIAALSDWSAIEALRNAIKKDAEREWSVNFDEIKNIVGGIVDKFHDSASQSADRQGGQNGYIQRDELRSVLTKTRFSDACGWKLYWGDTPNSDGEKLRNKADWYYCANVKTADVLRPAPPAPTESVSPTPLEARSSGFAASGNEQRVVAGNQVKPAQDSDSVDNRDDSGGSTDFTRDDNKRPLPERPQTPKREPADVLRPAPPAPTESVSPTKNVALFHRL